MRFDLVDLRLLLNIAQAGSITGGGERSHMTLASASARIRAMEASLGMPLLERHRHGVRPTAVGRVVVHHARQVLHQLEAMTCELDDYAGRGRRRIRLLGNTSALAQHLPELLPRYLARHPDVDLDIEEQPSHAIVAQLKEGHADLGILADSADLRGLEHRFFRDDHLVLITPADSDVFAGRASVRFEETLDLRFVGLHPRHPLQAHLLEQAVKLQRLPAHRVQVADLATVRDLVAHGAGVAVVPAALLDRDGAPALRVLALEDAWARRSLHVCARRLAELPAATRQLVAFLCGTAEEGEDSGLVHPRGERRKK